MFWRTWRYYVGLLGLLLGLNACVTEDLHEPVSEGQGYLRLVLASVATELSSSPQTKAATILSVPSTDKFTVKIYNEGTTVYEGLYTEFPSTLVVEVGDYTIEAYAGIKGASIETEQPNYFYGSVRVTILPNIINEASLTAQWGYSAIHPVVQDDLSIHYKSYCLEATVDDLTQEFTCKEDKSFAPFFLLAGTNVTISLSGTNYLGKVASTPLLIKNPLPAATDYNITVSPNIPEFSLGLNALATHTKDNNGYLNGTEVKLTLGDLSEVPTELITAWSAQLVNNFGQIFRVYSATGSPVAGATIAMEMPTNADYPYVPQGSYTLNYKYTINDKEVTVTQGVPVTVPAPELSVIFAPYTSYTKYKEGNVTEANNCANNIIYNLNASVNISNDLMTKYSGALTYTYEGTSETVTTNFISKDDITVSEWKQYSVSVSVTFDGLTQTVSPELHITGLPYSAAPPTKTLGWSCSQSVALVSVKWEDTYLRLAAISQSPKVSSPNFHIPNEINTDMRLNIKIHNEKYFFKWRVTNFVVNVNGNSFRQNGEEVNDKNYEVVGSPTFSPTGNTVTLQSSYNMTVPYVDIYNITIKYK